VSWFGSPRWICIEQYVSGGSPPVSSFRNRHAIKLVNPDTPAPTKKLHTEGNLVSGAPATFEIMYTIDFLVGAGRFEPPYSRSKRVWIKRFQKNSAAQTD
jgi:hypothetical protein